MTYCAAAFAHTGTDFQFGLITSLIAEYHRLKEYLESTHGERPQHTAQHPNFHTQAEQ